MAGREPTIRSYRPNPYDMDLSDLLTEESDGTPGSSPGTGAAQSGTEGTRENGAEPEPGPEAGRADLEKFEEACKEKDKKRSFVFTINNPKLDPQELVEVLKNEKAVASVFQHELGENGTPHYQGWVRFKNARLYGPLCTLLSGWVRPCKNDVAARRYCSKGRTRIGGPYGFGCDEAKEEIKTIDEQNFYDWEKELVAKLDGPVHDREIIWRWSVEGNVGKSAFTKWLVVHKKGYQFNGKAADVKAAIADMVEAGKPVPNILIWDIPRTMENFMSYQALEEVKNGLFFSGKFHGQMVVYNPRHVLVFSNFEPDRSKLSEDRWSDVQRLYPQ